MTPKLLFSGYAIFAAVSGAAFLLAPSRAMHLYGVAQLDAVATSLARGAGALLVSLAVIYWTARRTEGSKARDGLFLGLLAANSLSVVLAVEAGLLGGGTWLIWADAAIFAAVTIVVSIVARGAWSSRVDGHAPAATT